ncbi:hypothetical protein K437DRAFT_130369 [Tilletiaria anomala UBC 951]|uniref:Amino acid permease/ SLC12A domain-containing protein n=1 Tax=Tilletiaria anomala (strain ATCC 24038 / CBS 436.72 / UBC 951) TaxID=1037660 RepID=A0A066VWK9_TILAU|nr:uncharacterized protein K437DRAFT_130369 [Tilletiaria anomala UBC 951]KDN44683.1 hypothetical protein K437DRAFT_130369 [Tilletiaria anomala UBC 951]
MAPVDLDLSFDDVEYGAARSRSRSSLSDRSGYDTAPSILSPSGKAGISEPVLAAAEERQDKTRSATADASSSSDKIGTDPESQQDGVDLSSPYLPHHPENETRVAAIAGERKDYGHLDFEGLDPDLVRTLIKDEGVRQGLNQRHLQLIALAGAIGTGLFLSTGFSLQQSGPLGLLLSFILVGTFVIGIVLCLSEMACLAPTSGSYIRFTSMFADKALGFATGLCLVFGCAITLPTEIVACVVLVQYWTYFAPALFVTVFAIPLILTNLTFVRWYGELEAFFAMLKILLVVILVITGIVIDAGGGPNGQVIGVAYWHNPGPWQKYLVQSGAGYWYGFWSCLINAAFSYAGVESVAMAAAETKSPRQNIRKAAKRVFFRVFFLYILSLFIVTLIVPSDDERLNTDSGTASQSPFVIAFQRAGISVLPSFTNAIVLTSAFSSGNQAVLSGSRALLGLSLDGLVPKFFRRTNRFGTPWIAVLTVCSLIPLAYTVVSSEATSVFFYLTYLSASGTLWSWTAISVAYLQVYYGMKKQGISRDSLPYKSPLQPYLTWWSLCGCLFILITSGFKNFVQPSKNFDVQSFLSSYLTLFINLSLFIIWKVVKKTRWLRLQDVPVMPWLMQFQQNPETPLKPDGGWRRIVTILWA